MNEVRQPPRYAIAHLLKRHKVGLTCATVGAILSVAFNLMWPNVGHTNLFTGGVFLVLLALNLLPLLLGATLSLFPAVFDWIDAGRFGGYMLGFIFVAVNALAYGVIGPRMLAFFRKLLGKRKLAQK